MHKRRHLIKFDLLYHSQAQKQKYFFKNPTQKTRATHNAYALKRVPHGDAVGEVDPGTQKYPALHCPLQAELDSDVPEP